MPSSKSDQQLLQEIEGLIAQEEAERAERADRPEVPLRTEPSPAPVQPAGPQTPEELRSRTLSAVQRERAQVTEGLVSASREVRPAISLGGALAGAQVGAQRGRALGTTFGVPGSVVGTAAGGFLGAFTGSGVGEAIQDVMRRSSDRLAEALGPSPNVKERVDTALREGLLDLAGTGAAAAVPQLLRSGRNSILRLFGVGPKEVRFAEEAKKQFGIEFGAAGISRFPVVTTSMVRVMGMIPLVRGPVKAAAERLGAQAQDALDTAFLLRRSPAVNMADIGVDLTNAAKGEFAMFKKELAQLYKQSDQLAKRARATVPGRPLARVSALVKRELKAKLGTENAKNHPLWKYVTENHDKLPADVPFKRFDGLTETTQVLWKDKSASSTPFAKGLLLSLQRAEGAALAKVISNNPNITAQELRKAYQKADEKFFKRMSLFETSPGRRFRRMGRILTTKFDVAASKNVDEAFNAVLNFKSAEGMKDLKRIVGRKAFNTAVKGHLSFVFEEALERGAKKVESSSVIDDLTGRARATAGIDTEFLRKTFGIGKLGGELRPEFKAWRQATAEIGFDVKKLSEFTNVLDAVAAQVPSNINAFVLRRTQLSGVRGIKNFLVPTADIGAAGAATAASGGLDMFMGAALVFGARNVGRLLTTPKLLKLYQKAVDPSQNLVRRKFLMQGVIDGIDALDRAERGEDRTIEEGPLTVPGP